MKSLVVYYSLNGNTKEAAEKIAKEVGADLLELETARKIPEKGFGKFFAGGAQASFGFCPKLKSFDIDLEKYDALILGTPIWASVNAPAVNTFLKKNKIGERVIAVFTCSGGGDQGKCIQKLADKLPNLHLTTSLTDRVNPKSSENEEKLKEFSEKYREMAYGK